MVLKDLWRRVPLAWLSAIFLSIRSCGFHMSLGLRVQAKSKSWHMLCHIAWDDPWMTTVLGRAMFGWDIQDKVGWSGGVERGGHPSTLATSHVSGSLRLKIYPEESLGASVAHVPSRDGRWLIAQQKRGRSRYPLVVSYTLSALRNVEEEEGEERRETERRDTHDVRTGKGRGQGQGHKATTKRSRAALSTRTVHLHHPQETLDTGRARTKMTDNLEGTIQKFQLKWQYFPFPFPFSFQFFELLPSHLHHHHHLL